MNDSSPQQDAVGASDSQRFRGALAWSFVLNGARQALTSLFTLALAAMLGPEEFGTVTIAFTFVLFLQLFIDQGVGEALVQRKELDDEHLTAAFWLMAGGSLLLALAGVALSPWWAAANRLPSLAAITAVLTLTIPLQALFVVQQALLRRRMDFRSLAVLANAAIVASGALGFLLARRGYGVWALVAYQLAIPLSTLVLYALFTRWRPGLRFSLRAARELLGFSAGSLLAGFGSYVGGRADALVMGLLFGPAAVGAYRLAERLVALAIESAARPVQAVALPEFARLQDDRAALAASTVRCIRISAVLTVPPLVLLAAAAPEATALIGPKWTDATGALRWLCLAGAGRALTLFLSPLLLGIGRPHALAGLLWGTALPSALVACIAALLVRGAPTADQAAAVAGSRAVLFLLVLLPVGIEVGRRVAGVRVRDWISAVAPSVGAGLLAAGAAALVRAIPGLAAQPALVRSLAVLSAGGLAGGLGVLCLDAPIRREVVKLRKAALAR